MKPPTRPATKTSTTKIFRKQVLQNGARQGRRFASKLNKKKYLQERPALNTAAKDQRLKSFWSWIQDPIVRWSQDHGLMFSAAIAFFAAFSLAPTLVIIIAV